MAGPPAWGFWFSRSGGKPRICISDEFRAEAEAGLRSTIWEPLCCKNVPLGCYWKRPYAGKNWEEKGATEDEMAGRHHRLHGREFEQLRELVKDREAWCAAVRATLDTTQQLNNNMQVISKWKQWETLFSWTPKSLWTVTAAMKLKMLVPWKERCDKARWHIRKQRHLPKKVRIVKATVFPVVTYRCEGWTIKKAERQRMDAFELWCWRRLLRVPWTARTSNQPIVEEISPEKLLERPILKLKLKYFGQLTWQHACAEHVGEHKCTFG